MEVLTFSLASRMANIRSIPMLTPTQGPININCNVPQSYKLGFARGNSTQYITDSQKT